MKAPFKRDLGFEFAHLTLSELKPLRRRKAQDVAILNNFFEIFTPLQEHSRMVSAAYQLHMVNENRKEVFVTVEGKRCLCFMWNKNSGSHGSLKEWAIEGQTAVFSLWGETEHLIFGRCLAIHDDGDHLDFQPINPDSVKQVLAGHSRRYSYFDQSADQMPEGYGWSGWRNLDKDSSHKLDLLHRFRARTFHISEIAQLHQLYDWGTYYGPVDVHKGLLQDTESLQGIDAEISRKKSVLGRLNRFLGWLSSFKAEK